MLRDLYRLMRFRRMRQSSFDRSGANRDSVRIDAGETYTVPELFGPGVVRHIWMTVAGEARDLYQRLKLVIRFDGTEVPQVDVPLADFFLFGHGLLVDVDSTPIQVSRQPHILEKPYRGGLNCMLPMPFERSAAIAFQNTGDATVHLYYYVDWEAHPSLSEPVLPFHATLNDEHTQPPAGQAVQPHGRFDRDLVNQGWQENYVFLNVEGVQGHYVGTGLSVHCQPDGAGKWWEGDDMFVIDGEPWPPRLHGTGTEDYFNLAWGFRQVGCRPAYGITFLDKRSSDIYQIDGRFSMYRFHLSDPIPFTRSLIASIEHGHANDCEAYYRSVAYWYGRPLE